MDTREREKDLLVLIIDSYIEESRPISSAYLCEKYNLSCSPATVRSIMVSLEKKGFLSHIHTSSGRVPTKAGFQIYVDNLKEKKITQNYPINLSFCSLLNNSMEGIIDYALDALAKFSGYPSLFAVSGKDERLFFKGVRCILEQPEFMNISRLRHIFYALEVRMDELQSLLFRHIDEKIQIVIGDDIGFEEISDCSLVVSGFKGQQLEFAIALLGPMRMNYLKATSCLGYVRDQLKEVVADLV